MSRNDVIIVARSRNRHFVLGPLNADTEWKASYLRSAIKADGARFTTDRAKALIIAHDMQSRQRTEYGVHEFRLRDAPKTEENEEVEAD